MMYRRYGLSEDDPAGAGLPVGRDPAPAPAVTWITVCETCRRPGSTGGDPADGATLASFLDDTAAGLANVQVRRHACLMGCQRACNVVLQARGKLAYSLADFTPDREAAEAIVAWAALHAESETGQVPYRQWPQGVKGHFVSRHPPLPE